MHTSVQAGVFCTKGEIMKSYGLILAGGGAKGAYQIGAWKALREMKIEIEAIAGVSIGAINGALIAQNDFEDSLDLWNHVQVSSGVNLSGELKDPSNLFSFSNFPQLVHEIIRNGGVDATPAKELISKHIDEEKVRDSGIPLGIMTIDLSTLKPVELFVEDMPQGELIDYLMASARVPGLNRQGPRDGSYLDGGVYDNAPIGILRKRGINRLIVVDISGIKGIGHKQEIACANVVYIRPFDVKELGESFEFDIPATERRIQMGYLDTKKAFGYLAGQFYYFSPREMKQMHAHYGYNAVDELERLALEYELPRLVVYTEKQFFKALKAKIEETDREFEEKTETSEKKGLFSGGKLQETSHLLLRKLSFYTKSKKYANAIKIMEDFSAS